MYTGHHFWKEMFPMLAYTRQIIMFKIPEEVEVETDQYRDDLRIRHHVFCLCLGASEVDESTYFVVSTS